MGTALTVINGKEMQVPAHVLERRKQRRAAFSQLGTQVAVNRISLDGKQFQIKMHGQTAQTHDKHYLDVAIVAMSEIGRQYYKDVYDPNAETKSGPVCWSSDGLKPDAGVAVKQCALCKQCPKNQKGSHPSGRGKACSSLMRIGVQVAGDPEEDRTYVIDAKGMSLFGKEDIEANKLNGTTYLAKLREQDLEAQEVWTRLAFDQKESAAKLFFKTVGFLEPEHTKHLQTLASDPKMADMLRIGGIAQVAKVHAEETEEVEAPAPKKAIAAPKAVEPEEEEEAAPPPPKKKVAAKAAVVEEEEEAAPAPKPKAKAVAVAEEEDEAPAPKPKAKAKPAPVADEEEEAAPPPPKKKAAAKPVVAEEEEEEEAPAPKKTAGVQVRAAPKSVSMEEIDDGLGALVGDWEAPDKAA